MRRPCAARALWLRHFDPARSAASSAGASARVGVEKIDACQGGGWQPGEDVSRVTMMQADVGEALCVDRRQCLRHAVDEWLDADEAAIGIKLRLRDEVFGTAEADFEPYLADGMGNSSARSAGAEPSRSTRSAGSKVSVKRTCPARSFLPLRRPKKAPCRVAGPSFRVSECITAASMMRPFAKLNANRCAGRYFTALRIWSARSVFSHEKPPSLSGARPKWP